MAASASCARRLVGWRDSRRPPKARNTRTRTGRREEATWPKGRRRWTGGPGRGTLGQSPGGGTWSLWVLAGENVMALQRGTVGAGVLLGLLFLAVAGRADEADKKALAKLEGTW